MFQLAVRQLIIRSLQSMALSLLLQLTLSTTKDIVSSSESENDDINEGHDAEVPTEKRTKHVPRPGYEPLKLKLASRTTQQVPF